MAQGRATTKHRVKLTADERDTLSKVIRHGGAAHWKRQRAQALLKCDEGQHGPGWSDEAISEAFEVTVRTLENWRKQAVEYGPLSLLERKTQDRARFRKLDGAGEARLAQLACSDPPDGYGKWSLRLLADELVTLEIVDSIGHECVRQTLKKTSSSPGGKRCGASRPSKTQHS